MGFLEQPPLILRNFPKCGLVAERICGIARDVSDVNGLDLRGELSGGYYVLPTIFEGKNNMRIFQEEIFGPVVSVTKFDGFDNAMEIANDTLYGLGAGVWTRDMNTAYRAGREIKASRVLPKSNIII